MGIELNIWTLFLASWGALSLAACLVLLALCGVPYVRSRTRHKYEVWKLNRLLRKHPNLQEVPYAEHRTGEDD